MPPRCFCRWCQSAYRRSLRLPLVTARTHAGALRLCFLSSPPLPFFLFYSPYSPPFLLSFHRAEATSQRCRHVTEVKRVRANASSGAVAVTARQAKRKVRLPLKEMAAGHTPGRSSSSRRRVWAWTERPRRSRTSWMMRFWAKSVYPHRNDAHGR